VSNWLIAGGCPNELIIVLRYRLRKMREGGRTRQTSSRLTARKELFHKLDISRRQLMSVNGRCVIGCTTHRGLLPTYTPRCAARSVYTGIRYV